MALYQCSSLSPFIKEVSLNIKSSFVPHMVKVKGNARVMCNLKDNQTIVRRSADYHPPIWKYEFVQSLTSEFMEGTYARRLNELKIEVRTIISQLIEKPLKQLELIDTLQRLGISYHFKNEINNTLENIYINNDWKKNNLYSTALEFRLLRQHGFKIPQDVFIGFKDEIESSSTICKFENIKGMLALYEASFLLIEGENVLEEARCFTRNYLKKCMSSSKDEIELAIAAHALELPLHWRMPRLEARWFIDIYERKEDMNSTILEMAKLDFNMVQSIHQEDLKYTSRWWKSTGLGEKLTFARDRLMENYLWTVGIGFEPEFSYFRRMSTKINTLITIIDDVYDVYGTLDELELFTDAVERWDIAAIDQLPDYMKVCFLTLHNSINEMAFDALRDQGINVIQYLKKTWVDLCKSYLLEAKWYDIGYKPTLKEYLNNAWISISGPVILVHGYVFVTSSITKRDLESLKEYGDIIRWSSTILRLADDLGTSSDELKRGDVPKSIQCYMNEAGASENDAREYIKDFIDEAWKKLNKIEVEKSVYSQAFIELSKNLARMSQCMYQYGDGHAIESQETKDRVVSLLIRSIPIC